MGPQASDGQGLAQGYQVDWSPLLTRRPYQLVANENVKAHERVHDSP